MKQFFKTVFASALGVLIASGIIMLGFIFFIIGMVASADKPASYSPKPNTVLKISLKGTMKEQSDTNPLAQLMSKEGEQPMALNDLLKAIRLAKENENIKGIYLEAGALSAGPASMTTIRRALSDFRESGKFIVAYGDDYGQGCYYLCSVADSLFLNPQGAVSLVGLASQGIFLTGLGDKIGVKPYIFKVGTYKGAVEPLILEKFSDANREQINSYMGSIWGNMLSAIEKDRKIAHEDLGRFINEGMMMEDAQQTVNYKLADALRYKYEVENSLKTMLGLEEKDKLQLASVDKMINISEKSDEKKDKIAILYAEGEIDMASSSSSPLSMDKAVITEKMADELRKLKDQEDVKAVVFRVNSPGGSAYVSEQIWKQVVELKKVKPVVVSMGDYAASGGYYISCAASKIVAEPTTMTGSIGVFGIFPNTAGLLSKIGVTTDVVKTDRYADLGDFSRPMREDEKRLIQRGVERTYDLFLTRCADGRGLTKAMIDSIGQGRVWTGEQALERKLVDKLGDINTAVEEAALLADIKEYSVTSVSGNKDFFSEFMEKAFGEVETGFMKAALGDQYQLFRKLRRVKGQTGIMAVMPYRLEDF